MHQKMNSPHLCNAQVNEEGTLTFLIDGRLDSYTTGEVWRDAIQAVKDTSTKQIVVDASGINYCDASGIALFVELRQLQKEGGRKFEVRGLASEFQQLFDLFPPEGSQKPEIEKPKPTSLPKEVGRATVNIWGEILANLTFVGEFNNKS